MDVRRTRRPTPENVVSVGCRTSGNHTQFSDGKIMALHIDKKPSRLQVPAVLFLAIAGTIVVSVGLSLKTQSKQPVDMSFDSPVGTKKPLQEQQLFHTAMQAAIEATAPGHRRESPVVRSIDEDNTLRALVGDFNKFEPDTCASRKAQHLRSNQYRPSEYLIQRLREYESLHRKCAIHAKNFVSSSTEHHIFLNSSETDCQYVVWIAYSGLGNRLLTLASAFLYALLTNRILLVDRSTDMSDLFCEPFPGTSWLVPEVFPHAWLEGLNKSSPHKFGKQFNESVESPAYSYIDLTHGYDRDDYKFFCDRGQEYLRKLPWLFMRSDNYIIPGLFFLSSFSPELERLFPEKEAIFHLLGRYLFHPSNAVWGWISRFRRGYLGNREEQVGIQIRTFNDTPLASFQEQLYQCVLDNKLLPNVITVADGHSSSGFASGESNRLTSVLVTSLQRHYYENLRDFYMSAPTEDGRMVAVHQPSQEGWQRKDSFGHDLKAFADIYLLSLSDVLITSGWSTFGYTAQGLGAKKPWILYRSLDYKVPNPPCVYAKSIEPCFHSPPLMDCQDLGARDPAKLLPFVQNCEDISWGIKIVDPDSAV